MKKWSHWIGAASLAAAALQGGGASVPNPVLALTGTESYSVRGKNFVRYRFDVANKALIPDDLFAAAPNLPPCGTNTNASRTWVDFYAADGTRLYGFCALDSADDLGGIWFAVEEGTVPPSWVYIEMTDRSLNRKYRSNLAETTL